MNRALLVASGVVLVVGFTVSIAGAQCAFQHPKKAKEVTLSFVQAFVPCDSCVCVGGWDGAHCTADSECSPDGFCSCQGANSMTEIGVLSCKPPKTYNEVAGAPPNGWLWGPNSSGTVSFKAAKNKIVDPVLNPMPNTADVEVRIKLTGIEDALGPVDGTGVLVPVRRTTFEDRAGGDMTVVDLSLPLFPVTVFAGRASVRTSANVVLNAIPVKGVPGCTSLELVQLDLRDENGRLFGIPGIFVPDLPNQ